LHDALPISRRSAPVPASARTLRPSAVVTTIVSTVSSIGATEGPAAAEAPGVAASDAGGDDAVAVALGPMLASALAAALGGGPGSRPPPMTRMASTRARIASRMMPPIISHGNPRAGRRAGGAECTSRCSGGQSSVTSAPRARIAGHESVPKEPRDRLMQSLGPRTPPGQQLRYGRPHPVPTPVVHQIGR